MISLIFITMASFLDYKVTKNTENKKSALLLLIFIKKLKKKYNYTFSIYKINSLTLRR